MTTPNGSNGGGSDSLNERLGMLLQLIMTPGDKIPAAGPAAPAPDMSELEFAKRFASEAADQAEELERRLEEETSGVKASMEKALADVRKRLTQFEQRVRAVEDKPVPVKEVETVIREVPAPAPAPLNRAWTMTVTSKENGLMKTVLAQSEGRSVTFTVNRTPDYFPSSITIVQG